MTYLHLMLIRVAAPGAVPNPLFNAVLFDVVG